VINKLNIILEILWLVRHARRLSSKWQASLLNSQCGITNGSISRTKIIKEDWKQHKRGNGIGMGSYCLAKCKCCNRAPSTTCMLQTLYAICYIYIYIYACINTLYRKMDGAINQHVLFLNHLSSSDIMFVSTLSSFGLNVILSRDQTKLSSCVFVNIFKFRCTLMDNKG